jgi:hypothetical protein
MLLDRSGLFWIFRSRFVRVQNRQKPLIHRHFRWCCRTGLNCRPLPYQGSALPLSYGSAGRGTCPPEARGNCHKGWQGARKVPCDPRADGGSARLPLPRAAEGRGGGRGGATSSDRLKPSAFPTPAFRGRRESARVGFGGGPRRPVNRRPSSLRRRRRFLLCRGLFLTKMRAPLKKVFACGGWGPRRRPLEEIFPCFSNALVSFRLLARGGSRPPRGKSVRRACLAPPLRSKSSA